MAEQKRQSYDVIVVGSGASGGWACKRLAEAGLKVALLEAGRPQSDKNFTEHKPAFELKYRNKAPEIMRKTRPIQIKFGVCNEYTYNWFVNDLEEPYTTPADKPFNWMGRLRITGGRTNVWGRVSLRFCDWDFKSASQDGYGEDWPHGHALAQCESDQTPQRPRPLPLLRPLRTRLHDPLVFQFRVHHRRRCPCHRQLYAHLERHGPQGPDGPGQQPRSWRSLRGSRHAPVARNLRAPCHSLRPIAGVCSNLAELRYIATFKRSRQFQRRPRALPHRTRSKRRRQRRISRPRRKGLSRRTRKAARHLHRALPQFAQRSALQKVSPRLWLRGRVLDEIQLGRPRLWRSLQEGSSRTPHEHRHHRLRRSPSALGWALHEAGIARMGADPKKSVLNQFQQTHDVKNLFVMDASGFTSNPCQNPTLTIMSLAVRSCDYLMSEMKRNSI